MHVCSHLYFSPFHTISVDEYLFYPINYLPAYLNDIWRKYRRRSEQLLKRRSPCLLKRRSPCIDFNRVECFQDIETDLDPTLVVPMELTLLIWWIAWYKPVHYSLTRFDVYTDSASLSVSATIGNICSIIFNTSFNRVRLQIVIYISYLLVSFFSNCKTTSNIMSLGIISFCRQLEEESGKKYLNKYEICK